MVEDRFSAGPVTALLSALFVLAGAWQQAEAAARCPAGDVFRASRGACQSKEAALSEGFFSFWPFSAKREEVPSPSSATQGLKKSARIKIEAASAPVRVKPERATTALVQIEKSAPLKPNPEPTSKPDLVLGFSSDAQSVPPMPRVEPTAVPIVARPVAAIPVRVKLPSPFGALIAFEPVAR